MPHIPWMDLAIVFYLYIQENENGIMTAAISDHHMKTWVLQSMISTTTLF